VYASFPTSPFKRNIFSGSIKGDRDLSFVGTAKERIENELALDYRSLRPSEIN
jgi:hypothetical protein